MMPVSRPELPLEIPCAVPPASIGELDQAGYLAANPDVARSGAGAREHFLSSGKAEGRLQWVNLDTVRAMRADKLGRVRLRPGVPSWRDAGDPLNVLSADIIKSFGIPDEVPVSANPYRPPVIELIERNRDRLFLDVGAGLRHVYYANVVNTDIYRSVCTDVICIGEELPFEDDQFDYVLSFAVMEHVKRPWDVAREMCRVLKPGGTIMVDWPFLIPVHGYPHHYFNATPQGNRSLLEEACDILSTEIEFQHHPIFGLNWMLTAWRNGLPPETARAFEAMTVRELIDALPQVQAFKPYCTELHAMFIQAIAAGSVVTGVKRERPSALR